MTLPAECALYIWRRQGVTKGRVHGHGEQLLLPGDRFLRG